jgi:hypothetical protein
MSDFIAGIGVFVALIALIVSIISIVWMSKQLRLDSSISIINWLEEVRPSRHLLYGLKASSVPFKKWKKAEKEAANIVCRQFDILGMLENLGYVDKNFVNRFYAIPAREVWEICFDWIQEERKTRGPQYLWEFEQLAVRVQSVEKSHPAITGEKQWPRNPRKPA